MRIMKNFQHKNKILFWIIIFYQKQGEQLICQTECHTKQTQEEPVIYYLD